MNVRIDPRQADDFAAAMALEMGVKPPPKPSPAPRRVQHPQLRDGDILIGDADTGGQIGLDLARLIDGRLLVQGASGAGKSWTLRRLLEQSYGSIQQIVIDPEGEFGTLAVAKGHLRLDAAQLDVAALATAARSIRAHRISVLLDLSDCEREDQMMAVAAFLRALIDAPREDSHAALVAIDEAHLFAPFGGDAAAPSSVRKAAIGALTDLMSRGRKRGLCGVLATQRLARLSKSVASEATNFLVGLNTLDLDIRRAAETIGWDARRAFDRLPMLEPGDFVAVGPAFSRSPCVLKVGDVETPHRGAAPALATPIARTGAEAAALLDIDALMASSRADSERREEGSRPDGIRAVRAFIREAGFAVAGRVLAELRPLAPAGARLSDLADSLSITPQALSEACALLDRYGVLEFDGEADARAVRVAPDFLVVAGARS